MSERPDDAPAGLPEAKRRRWPLGRWTWRYLVLPTLGLVVSGLIFYRLDTLRSAETMAALVADLDAKDSGWRLEEIEAARPEIPDDRNSARLCRDLATLLKRPWPEPSFQQEFANLPPMELLDDRRMKLLEAEMNRLAPARAVSRPMADLPQGRHRIVWLDNPIETKLPDQEDARRVAVLFQYESLYRANKGDIDGALREARATACVARSISDEPLLISQLVRVAILNQALYALESALALGEAHEAELTALENLLRDEERHNGYLAGVLGERGVLYVMYSKFAAGEIKLDPTTGPPTWRDKANLFGRMHTARSQPLVMELMNRWVEIARLPSHQQEAEEDALGEELQVLRRTAPLAVIFMPAANKVGQAWRRKTAYVAAMRGLIVVERYRMKHGEWPAKIDDVVPEFLPAVPTDPFDGTPIKMGEFAEGVVVYSVSHDGVDDGGNLDRKKPTAPGVDIGFRLWDVAKRRRPPSPPKEEEEP